jgi:hypothetical protein
VASDYVARAPGIAPEAREAALAEIESSGRAG